MITVTYADLKAKGEQTFVGIDYQARVETRLANQYWFSSRAAYEANELLFPPGHIPLSDEETILTYKGWLFQHMQKKHSVVYHELTQLALAEQQNRQIEIIVDDEYSLHGDALKAAIQYFATVVEPVPATDYQAIEVELDEALVQYGLEDDPADTMWIAKFEDITLDTLPTHRLIHILHQGQAVEALIIAPDEGLTATGQLLNMTGKAQIIVKDGQRFARLQNEGDWTFANGKVPLRHQDQIVQHLNTLATEYWPEPNVTGDTRELRDNFECLFDQTTGQVKYTPEDEQNLALDFLHVEEQEWEYAYVNMVGRYGS